MYYAKSDDLYVIEDCDDLGIYKRDKQIENLNKVIIELLKRIAILEREVEEHEGF